MAAIAGFLGVSVQELAKGHCRRVWLRVSLKEHSNGDCVFLTDEGCRVYPVRPSQCRTFPFWKANLRSERAWDAAKGRCPGMGCGRLYSREEIEQIMAGNQPT
jgi:Fe-S-cluster containining protein